MANDLDLRIFPELCNVQPRLIGLTGAFRVWMLYHFALPERIDEPTLRDNIWSNDPAITQIIIEPHSAYKPALTEHRPGIIIKRQKWTRVKLGIGDRRMGESPADGIATYSNAWQGSHTLFCLGGNQGEAEILGTEVFGTLNAYAPVVRSWLGLLALAVSEIGEVAKLEESGKNYVVPVNVAYLVLEDWRLQQQAPFLKRTEFSVLFS